MKVSQSKWVARIAALCLLGGGLAGCSTGGGPGLPALEVLAFNFGPGFGGVPLNANLILTFSAPVDPTTVNSDSIRIVTVSTTTALPDPGAPAIGTYTVNGDQVTFKPRVPNNADLSDAGLRIGFRYRLEVTAAPTVIEPVRSIEDDPNTKRFEQFFETLNHLILPAPSQVDAEANLNSLSKFFVDEWIDGSTSFVPDTAIPCPRAALPPDDRDSPQVFETDPVEGQSGFGVITGIEFGLGTAFVRLAPITLRFSEPVAPWRIRLENIVIRNQNLGGATFDLFFFFQQDRSQSVLQITVFDADSPFDQASVPQGRYSLFLDQFTDLAGNPLINPAGLLGCTADGTFSLSFSTVASPVSPTDIIYTFQDNDGNGFVDIGPAPIGGVDPNVLPTHEVPLLGGMATQDVTPVSPSQVSNSGNWGDSGVWDGANIRFITGYDLVNGNFTIAGTTGLRLRGGAIRAATAILAPIAGRGSGRSNSLVGSLDGSTASPEMGPGMVTGKVDFLGSGPISLEHFTGDFASGPITYHYSVFRLEETVSGRPTLSAAPGSLFPLLIMVEDSVFVTGTIDVSGQNGAFGFNGGPNNPSPSIQPGGFGGLAIGGGGNGGDGGLAADAVRLGVPFQGTFAFADNGGDPSQDLHGKNGQAPTNVLARLGPNLAVGFPGPRVDALFQLEPVDLTVGIFVDHDGNAGTADVEIFFPVPGTGAVFQGMIAGGGAHYNPLEDDGTVPGELGANQGGGGSHFGDGLSGSDFGSSLPGVSDQGLGGISFRTGPHFMDQYGPAGGAGGGGGSSNDDGMGGPVPDGLPGNDDDGGGGGGAGGGMLCLTCGGDITLGDVDFQAEILAYGGRGGSTYAFILNDEPALDTDGDPNSTGDRIVGMQGILEGQVGEGNAGGGGAGGGICIISGGALSILDFGATMLVQAGVGGNAPGYHVGDVTRMSNFQAGDGGAGAIYLADTTGAIDTVNLTTTPVAPLDTQLVGTPVVTTDTYGDDPLEILFGESMIVTEFFDTLSSSASWDSVTVLSNVDTVGIPGVIQVFLDVADPIGTTGLPNILAGEVPDGALGVEVAMGDGVFLGPPRTLPATGTISSTLRIPLTSFPDGTPDAGGPEKSETRFVIPVGPAAEGQATLGKQFARVRIRFDLANTGLGLVTGVELIGVPPAPPGVEDLTNGGSFVFPGLPPAQIAPGNTVSNTDTAPDGVPAVADVRVGFTPGNPFALTPP